MPESIDNVARNANSKENEAKNNPTSAEFIKNPEGSGNISELIKGSYQEINAFFDQLKAAHRTTVIPDPYRKRDEEPNEEWSVNKGKTWINKSSQVGDEEFSLRKIEKRFQLEFMHVNEVGAHSDMGAEPNTLYHQIFNVEPKLVSYAGAGEPKPIELKGGVFKKGTPEEAIRVKTKLAERIKYLQNFAGLPTFDKSEGSTSSVNQKDKAWIE